VTHALGARPARLCAVGVVIDPFHHQIVRRTRSTRRGHGRQPALGGATIAAVEFQTATGVSARDAGEPGGAPAPEPPRDAAGLLELSQVELDRLFRRSPPGEIPTGRGRGTPIFAPGTPLTGPVARVAGTLAWRGKVFSPDGRDLKNLISPLSIRLFRALVYRGPSWLDDRECIVLDYSRTSTLTGWIRDEIREVSPGLYLGVVYGVGRAFGGERRLDVGFALEF
jgi:hypothetical protein